MSKMLGKVLLGSAAAGAASFLIAPQLFIYALLIGVVVVLFSAIAVSVDSEKAVKTERSRSHPMRVFFFLWIGTHYPEAKAEEGPWYLLFCGSVAYLLGLGGALLCVALA